MKLIHKIIRYTVSDYYTPGLIGPIPKGKTIGKSFSDLNKAFKRAENLNKLSKNNLIRYYVKSEAKSITHD